MKKKINICSQDEPKMRMMEGGKSESRNDEVFSKVVRAGKRTYFFDVKSTRNNDLYITVTESKKTTNDGRFSYEKHKLFLYKEDFEKFKDGLHEAFDKIDELKQTEKYAEKSNSSNYSSVNFDELGE